MVIHSRFLLLCLLLLEFHLGIFGYYELVEELGCHDTEFRLTCGPLDAQMVILEATFSRNDSYLEPFNTSCGNPGQPVSDNIWGFNKLDYDDRNITYSFQYDFRTAVNRRCSGVNHCSFILSSDHPPATRWGPGSVYLRYACMDGTHVVKSCRANITVHYEGFVQTPGYPRFYVGGRNCHWTLQAPAQQRVRVTLLDMSLRGLAPYERNCIDLFYIVEDGTKLFSSCGDLQTNVVLESIGSEINVSLTADSKHIFPKRGILFHYKAIGCPVLHKPKDGYLIFRNETFAKYRCCIGYMFPDTLNRTRSLYCLNENYWDVTLPDCVELNNASWSMTLNDTSPERTMKDYNVVSDLIVPIVLMCVLLIGNGILVYVIFNLRKKSAQYLTADSEMLTSMTVNNIGIESPEEHTSLQSNTIDA